MLFGIPDLFFPTAFPLADMPLRFVNPNYHVILVHYPLGVFVLGVILELGSMCWRRSSVRIAAHWMIVLGALASIPAATSGIYALSDVAANQQMTAGRYHNMFWHVWLQSAGTLVAVFVALFALGASDRWRRKLYLVLLAGGVAAWGLMAVGAWCAGESVYRQGTAVTVSPEELPSPKPVGDVTEGNTRAVKRVKHKTIYYYIGEPVQLHIVVAGVAFAVALGALGLSMRQVTSKYPDDADAVVADLDTEGSATGALERDDVALVRSFNAEMPLPAATVAPRLPAATFWLLGALIALTTAGAGYWTWAKAQAKDDPKTPAAFFQEMSKLTVPESSTGSKTTYSRAAVHTWLGIGIVVLPLLLAGLARFASSRGVVVAIFGTVFVLAIAVQVWLGVLLQFDAMEGPLWKFTGSTPEKHEHDQSRVDSPAAPTGPQLVVLTK